MKTDRLTLLIAPAEKAAIAERAAELGLSVSELVRRAVLSFSPEDAETLRELEAALPEANAALDRMHDRFERMIARLDRNAQHHAYLNSDEHRAKIQEELADDRSIDWDAMRMLFGIKPQAHAA